MPCAVRAISAPWRKVKTARMTAKSIIATAIQITMAIFPASDPRSTISRVNWGWIRLAALASSRQINAPITSHLNCPSKRPARSKCFTSSSTTGHPARPSMRLPIRSICPPGRVLCYVLRVACYVLRIAYCVFRVPCLAPEKKGRPLREPPADVPRRMPGGCVSCGCLPAGW